MNSLTPPSGVSAGVETATLARPPMRPMLVSAEVLALTVAGPLAGWLRDASDPFLLRAGFPWLSLVPLLLGVQHGLVACLVSATLLIGGGLAHQFITVGQLAQEAYLWALGCGVSAVLAGHFSGATLRRANQLARRAEEFDARLERVQRAYDLVRLSHQQLEERFAAADWSLDGAAEDALKRIERASSEQEAWETLLGVLAGQVHVQSAAVYGVSRARGGAKLVPGALATLGSSSADAMGHPVVQRALSTGELCSVSLSESVRLGPADKSVLAAAPVITSAGVLLGVVVIHDMPFIAFRRDNLSNLVALVRAMADPLSEKGVSRTRFTALGA